MDEGQTRRVSLSFREPDMGHFVAPRACHCGIFSSLSASIGNPAIAGGETHRVHLTTAILDQSQFVHSMHLHPMHSL